MMIDEASTSFYVNYNNLTKAPLTVRLARNAENTVINVDNFVMPSMVYSFNDTNTMDTIESDSKIGNDACIYTRPPYMEERFWLVTVVGTSVAIISVFENLFLFFILVRKKSYRNSHCLYLILLAFFDVFMGAAYVPLMSFSLLLDYLESVLLLRAWYTYMTPLITTSHIAMTSSSFLILAASFERYCITCWTVRVAVVNRRRAHIATAAILFGVITKITLAKEFEITFNERCRGTMLEYGLKLSSMALDYHYNLFWRLGFRNVVTVLLPFFLLLVMNLRIVAVLRRSNIINIPFQNEKINEIQRKRRVRAATRTLLMLVFTYLMANVLNVIMTFWEYIDIRSLTEQFIAFYTFGVDTVSILTILAGALRLPIYVSCMPQLRRDIFGCLKRTYDGSNSYKRHHVGRFRFLTLSGDGDCDATGTATSLRRASSATSGMSMARSRSPHVISPPAFITNSNSNTATTRQQLHLQKFFL